MFKESVKAFQEAKGQGRDTFVMTIFGLVLLGLLPIVCGYALLLWYDGALVRGSLKERNSVFDAVVTALQSCSGRISGARMPAFY